MPTNIDPMWIWIAVGIAALIIVAALIARGARKARSAQLRDKFGAEYDHVVQETGKRKRAEQELLARVDEVKKYEIRPFSLAERDRQRRDSAQLQQRFIERPTTAVVEADELVAEMMRVRGYPMGDFEKHAADLSVTHPRVVEHYRAGHRVIGGTPGKSSTEDLRQAMLHYRALFDELIREVKNDVAGDMPRATEISTPADVSASSSRRPEPRTARDGDRRDTSR
jgi:hypothetical protein